MTKKNPHRGTTLDTFLNEDGIREAAKAETVTRLVAWQLTQEMECQGMTKAKLAELMHTSRAQVDRILRAKGRVAMSYRLCSPPRFWTVSARVGSPGLGVRPPDAGRVQRHVEGMNNAAPRASMPEPATVGKRFRLGRDQAGS
jgi:antitoxin HicB